MAARNHRRTVEVETKLRVIVIVLYVLLLQCRYVLELITVGVVAAGSMRQRRNRSVLDTLTVHLSIMPETNVDFLVKNHKVHRGWHWHGLKFATRFSFSRVQFNQHLSQLNTSRKKGRKGRPLAAF